MDSVDNPEIYMCEKNGDLNESPEGTIYIKPKIVVMTLAGKYTMENKFYFDTFEEADQVANELLEEYKNKFVVIK